MTSLRTQMRYLNPYEIHKLIINEYVLKKPGDTKLLQRDKSSDRTDYHVIKENHKFLWEETDKPETWEEQFAKKYYDKLFKEYCIADLSRYKENKVALRWRVEKEVVGGKGQFTCGNKFCNENENLRSWEVNFAYQEHGQKKNALVKIRLCPTCSKKLNYHSKKREIKRLQRYEKHRTRRNKHSESSNNESPKEGTTEEHVINNDVSSTNDSTKVESTNTPKESPWEDHKPVEIKSREEEMEEYLQDLLI